MTNSAITINGQKLIQVDKNTYEGVLDDIDFVITKEKSEFFVDIFDSLLGDSEDAHLNSMAVDSLEQAVEYVKNY